jgi:polysaccharide biosynthesis/export protein
MHRLWLSGVLLAALWACGPMLQAQPQQRTSSLSTAVASAPASSPPASSSADYVIGPDDLLSIVFWRDQQLSADVLVRPDGKISVTLLDDVQAAGLTPEQLRDRLIAGARKYVTEPVATVIVKQTNSRKVFITGLVSKPGQYPLSSSMTVLQLIATAGGLLDFAKSSEIRVKREEPGRTLMLQFDYDAVIKGKGKRSKDLELKPGDIVIVP